MRRLALALGLLLGLSASVLADQTDPKLDALFDDLAVAEEAPHASRLESRIWQLWLEAPNEPAQQLIAAIEHSMRSGDLETALDRADALVEQEPDYAEGWNKRATVRYLVGDYDGSVSDIRRTLALEPRHFGAISGLGLIFLRQGDKPSALAAFEQVLVLSPASRHARDSAERVRRELDSDI